jgi:hypothetical protein
MGRFLTRIFTADPDGWILKGGTGMMIRLPDARHSKDIDLMPRNFSGATDGAEITLRQLVRDNPIDPFSFEIGASKALAGGKGVHVRVIARLGAQQFDEFGIDLLNWHDTVGAIEDHLLPQAPSTDDFPSTTTIRLYPIADQVADKLCALHEIRYTPTGLAIPSSRYRDLVDLLLISSHLYIPFAETVAATEFQCLRRDMTLPTSIESPGPDWPGSWAEAARESPLPPDLYVFEAAIAAAQLCYDYILRAGADRSNTLHWDPAVGAWVAR